ncbi:restriction endonuclease subunit S [Methanobacterium sp.]|uniref:restriction endonuclease subunit S n=1 Tax=Methanobacterium sp. TaxID=2164 RepID=UPI0025E49A50|nr:restriction endonuclease subunit S [Methanobacterium sp.]MBI5458933.1 restriction endonuclease subunit S [Methanobacterium sp.]
MMYLHNFKKTEIGLIPEDWEVKRIKDVCKLVRKSFYPNENDVRPYLGLEHIAEGILKLNGIGSSSDVKSGKLVFNKGQILFGKLRPYFRKVYRPNFDGVCSTDIFVIDKKDNNDNGFLFYFFANPIIIDIATQSSEGTRMPRASWNYLSDLEFSFPNLNEQKAISNFLAALDQKIELNHEMNRTLEEIAQTLFRHWFIHFEFPDKNGQPYKSSDGEMVDSEVGEIPVGWKVKKLKNICNITMGQSPKSEFYNEEGKGLPFHQGVTNFGKRFPTDKMFCTVENKIAEYGDILFSVRAPVGRINIAKSKIVIGRGLSAIRHEKDFQSFLLYQLKNIFTEEDSMGSGTVFNAITRKDLDDLKVLVPNEEVDKQFNDFVSPMEKKIENLILENDNLTKIRDSLLPKLMTGKIRVVR